MTWDDYEDMLVYDFGWTPESAHAEREALQSIFEGPPEWEVDE